MKKILLLVATMLLLCGCTTNASPTVESTDSVDPTATVEQTTTIEPIVTVKPTIDPVSDTYNVKQITNGKNYTGEAELVFEFEPADPEYSFVQGAYFDGKTYYVAMYRMDETGHEKVRIQVMDETGKLLNISEPLDLDCAENMSYNGIYDLILVSHRMTYDGNTTTYSSLNAETLEIDYTERVDYGFSMIAYTPKKGSYVYMNELGTVIGVTNNYMDKKQTFTVAQEEGVAQGLFSDDKYIYSLNGNDDCTVSSKLLLYDWKGKLAFRIPLDFKTEDDIVTANLNIVDNVTYVMCNNKTQKHGAVYKIKYTYKEDSTDTQPKPTENPVVKETNDIKLLTEGRLYSAHADLMFEFAPEDPEYRIIQGAYFDGERFYVATTANDAEGYEKVRIQVMDKDGKLIKLSDPLELDHANNITFNEKENALIVTHCQSPDGHYYTYSKVDIDTLQIIETGELRNPFFAMAYSPERDQYASGQWSGGRIDIRNSNMHVIKSVGVETPETLSQGVFCDSKYIYFVRSGHEGGMKSEILVYDWSCRIIFKIPINFDILIEPENINIINGTTYVICNNPTWTGGMVYRLSYSIDE